MPASQGTIRGRNLAAARSGVPAGRDSSLHLAAALLPGGLLLDTRQMDAIDALRRIAFLLEAKAEPGYRVRAFRHAAAAIEGIEEQALREMASSRRLRELSGVGEVMEGVIREALGGQTPVYLQRLEGDEGDALSEGADALLGYNARS